MKNIFMNWLQASVYRAILLALILVSVVPIVVISILFIQQSTNSLTHQMEENLQLLARSKAEEINLKLDEVMEHTVIAGQLAEGSLQQPLTPNEIAAGLTRYEPDQRQIIGLDNYYSTAGGIDVLGEDLSNVYWPAELNPSSTVAAQIVKTENLDRPFKAIKSVSPDTQWLYFTTPEGMMRLYPWASNDHYPDQWDPREIIFYTVAAPENNPQLEPRWTAPYVDYAGAGWMITASVPMVNAEGEFLGIMSHDVTIESLKQIALQINVLGGDGYGFLIEPSGQVIAHPAFQNENASKGTQEDSSLLNQGSNGFQNLIQQMVDGQTGLGYYTADSGDDSLLVFAPVSSTGWSLGISIPREEVIAPAMIMRNRAILLTTLLIGASIILAITISGFIHKPVVQLLNGVRQISADRRADVIDVQSFNEFNQLAGAFNEMASRVWEREKRLKAKVAEMRIEIDLQRQQQRVDSIVETDFFKRLEANVSKLRADVRSPSS